MSRDWIWEPVVRTQRNAIGGAMRHALTDYAANGDETALPGTELNGEALPFLRRILVDYGDWKVIGDALESTLLAIRSPERLRGSEDPPRPEGTK